jgi:hypothetical protein
MAFAIVDLTHAYTVAPENRIAYDDACQRLQEALDQLQELQPRRESKEQAAARTKRREGREHRATLANSYDAPLEHEILDDPTPAPEIEDL